MRMLAGAASPHHNASEAKDMTPILPEETNMPDLCKSPRHTIETCLQVQVAIA